jgi:hypothetical protein
MANWIQNCQICNDGLCIRMEELKKTDLSEREAAEVLMYEALDSFPELKKEFSADKIRMRYRYHMKGKRVEEILPADSPFSGWPMCKVCGSTRVTEKHHWHGSGDPLEPEEHGLCKDCYSDQLPKCKSCEATLNGKANSHGLCKWCRKKELREAKQEDAQTMLDEREKEFNQISVDAETEEFWNDLIGKFETIIAEIQVDDAVPCGKVEVKTLDNIKDFRHQLFNLYGYLDDVIEQSEVSVRVQ